MGLSSQLWVDQMGVQLNWRLNARKVKIHVILYKILFQSNKSQSNTSTSLYNVCSRYSFGTQILWVTVMLVTIFICWRRTKYVGDIPIGRQYHNMPEFDVSDRYLMLVLGSGGWRRDLSPTTSQTRHHHNCVSGIRHRHRCNRLMLSYDLYLTFICLVDITHRFTVHVDGCEMMWLSFIILCMLKQ